MAQFIGDAVFMLELSLVSLGLIAIHLGRQQRAKLVTVAGAILAVGAAVTAICTSFYWVSYAQQGDFTHAQIVIRIGSEADER